MVTRGRQKSLRYGRTLHCRFARDLPTRVDAISVFEKRSIGAVNKTVEVQHRTVLPEEGTATEGLIARIPDDLSFIVNSECKADECNRDLYVNNQESPLLLFLFCEVFFIHD
jgi:hypothetical protein